MYSEQHPEQPMKTAGFDVPSGYFDHFQFKMLQRLRHEAVKEELVSMHSVLAGKEKLNPFEVPAGYFESFEWQMLQAINSPKVSQKSWLSRLVQQTEQWVASLFPARLSPVFAGICSLVFVSYLFQIPVERCTDIDCRIAQLQAHEIENYLMEEADELPLERLSNMNSESIQQLEIEIFQNLPLHENETQIL